MKQFLFFLLTALLTDVIAFPTYLNARVVDCPKNSSLIVSFPNPTNCSKFYQCQNGTKTEMTCPLQQQYNPLLRVCDDPMYAGCKENASSYPAHRTMPPLFHSQNNTNTTESPYTPTKTQTESQTTKTIKFDNNNNTQIVAGNDSSKALQNVDISNSTSTPSSQNSSANTSLVTPNSPLPSQANVEASTIKMSKEHANVTSSRVSNGTLVVRNNSSTSTSEVKHGNLVGESTPAAAVIKSSKEVSVTNGENVEENDDEDTTASSEDSDDDAENNDHEQNETRKPK